VRSGREGLQGSSSPGPSGILDYDGGASGREGNVNPSDRDRNDLGNGTPHGGTDEPRHDFGTPGEDDRWLRSVLENSSEIVTIVDSDGTLRYASPAFNRVLGYDSEESIGKMNVLDHVHPEDLPHVLEEMEKALSEGGITTNQVEYRFRHKDGSWRWMESVGTYLPDDPAIGGVVVTSRDVTERKETEERYRTLVEQIPAVTYIDPVDDPETSLYTSPHIEQMLGYTPQEWQTEKLWPKCLHPEDRERILAADERFEAGGTTLPSARPWRSACITKHCTIRSLTCPIAGSSWTASGRP